MGILANTVSICQFKVVGSPPKQGFGDWAEENLSRRGFISIDDTVSESSTGWATLDNIHDSEFADRRSFDRSPYLCFSMRHDERKVPQVVLKHHFEAACQDWLSTHPDMQWVPKQRKQEIKELMFHKLLAKTLAVPTITDVIWNTERGWILIATLNAKVIERFEKLFKQTFDGLGLMLMHPMLRAESVIPAALSSELARHNQANTDQLLDLIKDNLWLGRSFLLWMVYQTQTGSGDFMINQEGPAGKKEPYVAHVDSRLHMAGESEDGTKKLVCTGPQTHFREVRTALAEELQITDATLYMEKDEDVWKVTLKGEFFNFSSLKSPKVKLERDELTDEMDERESLFYERMYLVELGLQMFDSLLADFLAERLGKDWQKRARKIREWVQD